MLVHLSRFLVICSQVISICRSMQLLLSLRSRPHPQINQL
uniref:Uncharacterized protein n=1 Tax=Arundo donax TaxID=35708 RepID=A0A0A9DBA8_ARUDO